MKRNQISLSRRFVNKNKEFLLGLCNSEELKDRTINFSYLDPKLMKSAREKDEEMNLDSFLEIITRYYFVKLQIGSPASDIIRYHISGNQEGIERFCDIEFPFNNQNYTVISRLFNEIYGQNIESI